MRWSAIEQLFRWHKPRSENVARLQESVREDYCDLAKRLDAVVPDSDEKDLMMARLQESMFWGNAGIARHQ